MKPRFWGVIVFLLTLAVAATPASGGEAYVATAELDGNAYYMNYNPDGSLSDQQEMLVFEDIPYFGTRMSYGNGIGDFNNDGELDYVMALGNGHGDIFVFPKSGSGPQFDPAIFVGPLQEGGNPTDIAVADFNGDGNMDFVLNFSMSPNCWLYLGDGTFGFEPRLLANVSPLFFGIGLDAADFNNDGLADFVVGPNPGEPFHVLLGNGDGTFYPVPLHGSPSNGLAGIAAADFITDPDGNVDLAVSGNKTLDIYAGNGDGTFVLAESHTLPVNSSPLDNGDFNRDGLQDLLAANYDTDKAAVAVLIGDGNGGFSLFDTLIGGAADERKAVTAGPYVDNKPPVASLTPEVIEVTVGQTVAWDASASFDEDGTIVSYEWDYGDLAPATFGVTPMAATTKGHHQTTEPQSSYAYLQTGTYFVTLTVVDDQGATDTIQAEVQVKPLEVGVYFSPRRLNLNSRGKWIRATIRVPAGYDARMIESGSLLLVLEGKAAMQARSVYVPKWHRKYHKKKHRRARKMIVKFDRQALIGALGDTTGKVLLKVTGKISTPDGSLVDFSGERTIKAYEKKKRRSFKHRLWQLCMRLFARGGYNYGRH